jgi:hypothetical protein
MAVFPSSFESKLVKNISICPMSAYSEYTPLDQDALLRREAAHILPAMLRVEQHGKRFAVVVGIAEGHGHEIALDVDGVVVADSERPGVSRVVDRSPEVDNLVALFDQLICVLRDVAVDASAGGLGRLVDVHLRHRLPILG